MIAGLGLVAFAALLFVPSLVQKHRHRKARARLRADLLTSLRRDFRRVTGQRDRYKALYHEAVARNAALLEHITDEREAAAVQALADAPNYFAAKAARQARTLDAEWLDLAMDEGLS